ncbi:MAG TPA: S1 RNA-binding domain-containing protein, partial [Anaerolineae bacterium]|nr:S1 RNA-binding domain-containing protein [Anaerolineae bacterium]
MAPNDFAGYVAQHYPRWSRAVGRVTKVQRFGVLVEFDDGIQGLIRRRELTWEGEANSSGVLSPGQRVEVVVINADHDSQRLELSRRLVERDPWQDFVASTQPGQAIRGQVVRVMPYGAIVEINPGLVGLVRVAEIAP